MCVINGALPPPVSASLVGHRSCIHTHGVRGVGLTADGSLASPVVEHLFRRAPALFSIATKARDRLSFTETLVGFETGVQLLLLP